MSIGRREFIAGFGGLGLGLGLGSISHWLPLPYPEFGSDWAPGREEFRNSTCLLCPSRCGIRGRLLDGKLVSVRGNPLHPVSRGGLCPKGSAGIQLLYHPARLTGPVERTGPPGSDQFRPISWDEATGRVADRLGELRGAGHADTVAWLSGDVTGIMEALLRRFAAGVGTPHFIHEDYADGSVEVMELCQGVSTAPAFDLAASDFVLSFGAPLSEAWWCLPQAARARDAEAQRRPRWVQLDQRHSRTAASADEWIGLRPGTFGTFALGIAYVILKEGLYDADRVRDEVSGLDDWEDESGRVVPGFRKLVLRHGRTERVAERTGVPADTLVRLAKAFGTSPRPVAVWDHSVSWRAGGLADAMAIHALNILVCALNRPGGVLVQPPLPAAALGDATTDRVRESGGRPKPPLAAHDWVERVSGEQPCPVNLLFLYYSNPVGSSPDPSAVTRAFERVPLVVSFSPFLDETARHADLVLPDHTYLERWQDAPSPPSVPFPVWGVVRPLSDPLHDTRNTGDVILDLVARVGGDLAAALPWSSVEELVQRRGKALAAARRGGVMDEPLRRDELRELEARGWWLPHGQSERAFWDSALESGGWFDPYYDYHDRSAISRLPGGKVRVFPSEARERIRATVPHLAAGFLPIPRTAQEEADDADGSLTLLPYRVMTLASGGTALMPWLLENLGVLTGDAWEAWAEINPETAGSLGVSSGQMVRVRSEAGEFRARLRVYAGAQPGTLSVPYGLHTTVGGWGDVRGSNPLRAVGSSRDPSTGLPDWYSTRVRITAV